MARREKRIKKWLENPPTEAPRHEVEAVVDYYFPDSRIKDRSGSHVIVIRDKRLKGQEGFGPLGHLEIPVKGGQKVKRIYLKKLALAVEIIKEFGEEDQ